MTRSKLKKWAENRSFPHVHQPDLHRVIKEGLTFMKGDWHEKVFGNSNPITLELGCGKGEYTVNLARLMPHRNFIGIDVKGHRFHSGAVQSHREGLKNVAFLRARIEFIESFFAPDEVDEIWLTFSDPQPGDEKGHRRITSIHYLERYAKLMKPGGRIHLKHDNPLVYQLMLEELEATNHIIETHTENLYGPYLETQPPHWQQVLGIRTHYESMWLEEGKKIHYLRFRVRPMNRLNSSSKPVKPVKQYTFFDNVYEVAKQIPFGRVTSYGAIARYLGTGLSSRMVGWAMNAAHTKPDVPAHRVVNRVGQLTGRHHFATPYQMQELLEAEGVTVKKNAVTEFEKLFWDPATELGW